MSEAERYAAAARTLIAQGNRLRDQGIRGNDTDVTVSPTKFLELLAAAWEEGFAEGQYDPDGFRAISSEEVNPYRKHEPPGSENAGSPLAAE